MPDQFNQIVHGDFTVFINTTWEPGIYIILDVLFQTNYPKREASKVEHAFFLV